MSGMRERFRQDPEDALDKRVRAWRTVRALSSQHTSTHTDINTQSSFFSHAVAPIALRSGVSDQPCASDASSSWLHS
eukprot:3909824-Rhodomonas_salina.1